MKSTSLTERKGEPMPADVFPYADVNSVEGRCRTIIPAPRNGWSQVAMGEWELAGEGWGDCHPHDEVTYVIEGLLEIDCDGERVTAGPGDVVRVPGGHPAYYFAPERARMLYIYGPNPDGDDTWYFDERDRVAPA
jgi:mannose-6-phosphate isomerase-like protein (cupin superfamily)